MHGTFTVADADHPGRIRVGSNRRYQVVEWNHPHTPNRWSVRYRYDVLARAIGRKLPREHVIDTHTGDTVA